MRVNIIVGLITVQLCALLFFAAPANAGEIYVHAGAIVDPETASVRRDMTIVVAGGKIVRVTNGFEEGGQEGDETVDLKNYWIAPGLVDTHSHVAFNNIPQKIDYSSTGFRALRGHARASEALAEGFTTLRDVGSEGNYAVVDLRRAYAEGILSGPTILNAGKPIAPFGGQGGRGWPEAPEFGPVWDHEYITADGPEEIIAAVRKNIFYGALVIKLVADQHAYYYSLAEIAAAAGEAHKAGLKLAVHANGGPSATNVINGGADSIEHGFNLSREQLKLMKQNGVYLSTTDFPLSHLKVIFQGAEEPADEWHGKIVNRLHMADEVGVNLTYGTDVIYPVEGRTRGQLMKDFLDTWKEAGVSPKKTLQAMTTNAYKLLGLEKERGKIAAGYYADMIAVRANPLETIDTLKDVAFVMKDGRIVKDGRKDAHPQE